MATPKRSGSTKTAADKQAHVYRSVDEVEKTFLPRSRKAKAQKLSVGSRLASDALRSFRRQVGA